MKAREAEPTFQLDARLQRDTLPAAEFPLCRLLLMRNADYPWFVLVPRRPGLTEMHALPPAERVQLMEESWALAAALERAFAPCVLNVAKLGNIVAQLHVHHVARRPSDPAWPGPVWGHPAATWHDAQSAERVCVQLLAHLPAAWR
jgi:diadenosine tetraphosphate (Ap4A) HIT family hydrolase